MLLFVCFARHFPRDSCTVLQLEKVLTLMARLPNHSTFSSKLQLFVIGIREHVPPGRELVAFTAYSFSIQGLAAPSGLISCNSSPSPTHSSPYCDLAWRSASTPCNLRVPPRRRFKLQSIRTYDGNGGLTLRSLCSVTTSHVSRLLATRGTGIRQTTKAR